ncbi:hypothetical protein L6452_34294 [Arctium lappa]|uniref:Uncharacterized protein n=1 Tax=Arctium lappa TaxID=4217 RepID=A0ACB8YIZ0_ARCLA|nr:hypothetical protein L6452_34294 [Arctium lappa]
MLEKISVCNSEDHLLLIHNINAQLSNFTSQLICYPMWVINNRLPEEEDQLIGYPLRFNRLIGYRIGYQLRVTNRSVTSLCRLPVLEDGETGSGELEEEVDSDLGQKRGRR